VTATRQGNCAGSVSTRVVVNAVPSVTLTSPPSGTTYLAPASIGVTASASDSDGGVSRVDFYANGVLLGGATSPPYTFRWSAVPIGGYGLTAVATDNTGATTTSAPVSVTVGDPGPSIVTSVVATPGVAAVGQTVTVTAYGTNPCGAINLQFGDGSGQYFPIVQVPVTWTHTYATAGVKTITAAGMGNCSGQVSATVTIQ
jgi:Bacterial Ig domain